MHIFVPGKNFLLLKKLFLLRTLLRQNVGHVRTQLSLLTEWVFIG